MKSPQSKYDEFVNSRFHQVSTDEVYGSIKKGNLKRILPTCLIPHTPHPKHLQIC